MELCIHISHSIPGRVRFCFSKPLKQKEKLKLLVMQHEGIKKMHYSPVTRSMLVYFIERDIDLQEILIRTALAFSLENQFDLVRITQKTQLRFITRKAIVAGVSIIATGITTLFLPLSSFQQKLNWLSAITTSAAVLEHVGYDYRKKGSVDPEVFSLVFLANSALAGKALLFPSTVTWLATFGRHFSFLEDEGVLLEIRKANDGSQNYEVNVSKFASKAGFIELLNIFAEKFLSSETGFDNTIFENSKTLLKSHKTNLEGVGEKTSRIVLNFDE